MKGIAESRDLQNNKKKTWVFAKNIANIVNCARLSYERNCREPRSANNSNKQKTSLDQCFLNCLSNNNLKIPRPRSSRVDSYVFFMQYYSELFLCDRLRDGWPYQNGWIFGKILGGGVISDPKIYIADFCHYKSYFGHEYRKSAILFFENEGGGGRFGIFPKIHPFW